MNEQLDRAALRDAIAFGVMSTDSVWNGNTMGTDPEFTDRRLDDLVDSYLAQSED